VSAGTIDVLETERLTCERLRPEHAAELIGLLRDPRVSPTIWPTREPPSEQEVIDGLESKIAHWERFGFGLWLLRDRRTGGMVGRGGLQHTFVAGQHEIEAGWAIVPERWNEGLATELARASVRTAFEALELRELVSFALVHNVASRRVMEKSGFSYEHDIEHVGLPHALYRQRRDQKVQEDRTF
jgi:ribosomal-protein-alanine N-acetyltransferase